MSSWYANRIICFLGGFIIAKTIDVMGLHKRFVLNILLFVGTNAKNIVAGFIIVTSFLSALMSNIATTMSMIPIGF